MYNYADDNTLSDAHEKPADLLQKQNIEYINILIYLFKFNIVQANREQFQAIAKGQRSIQELDSFTIHNVDIPYHRNEVKSLSVSIDCKLNFNSHNPNICK